MRSSEVLDEVRRAGQFGIDTGEVHVNWSRVIDRKETFTKPVTAATEQSLKNLGIDLIQGRPRYAYPTFASALPHAIPDFPSTAALKKPG